MKYFLTVNEKSDFAKMVLLLIIGCLGFALSLPKAAVDNPMIRFHIFANSDSRYDVQVKLLVKDSVEEYVDYLLQNAETYEETENILLDNIENIDKLANAVAAEYGYGANTQYGDFSFTERTLNGSTMKAGKYRALKISLGRGEGHNWFCVLYPEMSFADYTVNLTVTNDNNKTEIKAESIIMRFIKSKISHINQ